MTATAEARLVDEDGARRFRTVAISIVAAIVIVTLATTALVQLFVPDWGGGAALGIGAMVGFWTSPLTGGVAGNGIHELREERRGRASSSASTVPPTMGAPESLSAT
ncbi:MAG: hypothetical protein ACE5GB_03310 [Acidimicrobiales bacterium]